LESLWQSDRHEPLVERRWDQEIARGSIERIVADTLAAATPSGEWPNHPSDLPDDAPPLGGLYFGASGVIWALDYLARHGLAERPTDLIAQLPAILASNRTIVGRFSVQTRGYLLADAGVLLAQIRLAAGAEAGDELADIIAANTDDPARELMWGAPGTMLAARFMSEATEEARWSELFQRGASALKSAFHHEDGVDCELWTQDLYGQSTNYIGAVHGLAGNAFVLQAGRNLLPDRDWDWWQARLARALRAAAVVEGGFANWPATTARDSSRLVQHCHGAPGMVTSFAALEADIDDLLLAGGELTWRAGPLAKGSNLCHGTAGNGYAFLKLFERTGETLWLDRARAFAMHAIGQSEAEAAGLGRRRYTLWTGDLGLAIYLFDCLDGRARFPTLDVF
jgi:hypothetical protein